MSAVAPATRTVDKPATAVCYRPEEYAGFWRRVLATFIDFTFLLIAILLTSTILIVLLPGGERIHAHLLFWSGIALSFLYLVLLKRSRFRTLGYLISGVRVVDMQGKPPSIAPLTLRAMFALAGPLRLVEVTWAAIDNQGQTLHDKLTHTYVVRNRAVPAGEAAIIYVPYSILTLNFLFAEIGPRRTEA